MLLHHLAAFSDRFPKGFEGFKSLWRGFVEQDYLRILADNCRICVGIFFFLGGYGMYKRMESQKYSLFDSVAGIFKSYWKIFVIFVPIAYIFFNHSGEDLCYLATRYGIADVKGLITVIISDFFAFSNNINGEWWFIRPYICAIFMGSVYTAATRRNKSFAVELFVVFMIDILIRNFFTALPSIEAFKWISGNFFYRQLLTIDKLAPCFLAGITFAKFDAVVKIKRKFSEIPFCPLVSVLGCTVILWCRGFIQNDSIDIIYSAAFIVFASLFFDSTGPVKKIFAFLGKHSTNMWLCHTFFCYYFLETTKIVYSTRSVWIDLLILIAMSLAASIIIELIFKGLSLLYSKFKVWSTESEIPEAPTTK